MSTQHALALPSPTPSNTVVINARCSLRIEADQRVIVVAGLPVHHYRAEDAVAEAYAMVFLVASASPSRRTWRVLLAGRCALFGASKSVMNTAGWRRSVERKGGVAADGVSPGSVCALSRP